jgi:lysophospholipase L1-like esterase
MALLRPVFFLLLATFSSVTFAGGFELSAEQAERVQKFLPHTYPKLLKREPVHAACIGDSVMMMWGYDQDNGNALKAWNGVFLQELADQFIYNGGVRIVKPPKGQPEKLYNFFGPEITMQNFSRGGRLIIHAMQPLTTVAFENKPDIVIVSYGINDALSNLPLSIYRRGVQDVVDYVKAHNADLVLCGPSLILNEPPELGMALTRPYADTMREVAESNGVFFADLGDLAWLVQIEDRKHPLEDVIKKRMAADAAAAAAAATAAAAAAGADGKAPPAPPPAKSQAPVLENPIAADLDIDPDKKAVVSFEQIVESMKRKYNHGGTIDWLHPDTATQRLLGRRVFQELLDGPKAVPWKTGTATLATDGTEKATLTFNLDNPTTDQQSYTLLPLVTPTWRPLDAPSRVTLKAGKRSTVVVTYSRASAPDVHSVTRGDLLPSHEPFVRLPVLTIGGGMARIEDVRATLTPVAVVWGTTTLFNQVAAVDLEGWIWNTSTEPIEGKWEASWLDQKASGTFKTEGRSQSPFKVKLNMPATTGPTRAKGTLAMVVTTSKGASHFDREVEVVRNLSLKEPVPLLTANTYPRDQIAQPPMPGGAVPGVIFRADADSNALYLTYDIYGCNLRDNPSGGNALGLEINLDARSYGKRLGPGTTDAIRVTASAADGDAQVSPLPPWCFGTGYGMYYDESQIKAKLSSRPDGARRLTITLPRSYLYLHEWAMGNGNSEIGINTTMSLWQPGDTANAPASVLNFGLTYNGRHRDDAESLVVLELADVPTGRWTVRMY